MSNEELVVLATKVSEGKADNTELALYNAACESFQREQQGWAGMDAELVKMEEVSLIHFWKANEIKATVKLWPRIAAVAAAAMTIIFGVWFFNGRHAILNSGQDPAVAYQNDIAPGKNTATLTLANGKTIALSEAKTGVVIAEDKLAYNDGSSVGRDADLVETVKQIFSGSHSREAAMLTTTTPRGGTYQVLLPDGTKVWLNAGTSLKFPSTFTGAAQRKVELSSGEAYFEVSKDKQHPFIVSSKGQEVKVLGTHFNINSYDAEVKTTLFEGSVNVRQLLPKGDKSADHARLKENGIVLKPGEQSVVYQNTLKVYTADVEEVRAWKNGNFLFRAENIESIMRKISYWYNVEVVYEGAKPRQKITGVVGRNRKLSEVLNLLELADNIHFRIEGRRVYVTK